MLWSVRIVIETAGGQLVFASMKSRLPIDPEVAEHIARLLDHGNPYSDRNKSLSDLDDVCGHLVLLNSPIDAEKSWLTPTILAEFVLDTLTRIHEGQIVCSSHRKEFIALLKESLLTVLLHTPTTAFVGLAQRRRSVLPTVDVQLFYCKRRKRTSRQTQSTSSRRAVSVFAADGTD